MNKKIMVWMLVCFCLFGVANASLNDGLPAYWTFDDANLSGGNPLDVTGNGFNGTNNGATTGVTGILGQAFLYNTTDSDYVEQDAQIVSNYSFTINAWINLSSVGATDVVMAVQDKDAPDIQYALRVDATSNATMFTRNTVVDEADSKQPLSIGNWHMLTAVFVNNSITIWVNATELGNNSNTQTYNALVDRWSIGRAGDSTPGNYFDGLIDEVGIWNRSLSSLEITQLFNSGNGFPYPFVNELDINGPVNGTVNNVPLIANFTWNINISVTCELIVNASVVNQTVPVPATPTLLEYVNMTHGTWVWFISCNSSVNSSNRTYIMDTVNPVINVSNPVNGSEFTENFNLNISIIDENNFLAEVNITSSNGTNIFSKSYNTSGTTVFNITNSINHTFASFYTIEILAADGHTKNMIDVLQHRIVDKEVKFNPGDNEIKIYPNKKSDFRKLTTKKLEDRYSFGFERSKKRNGLFDEFIVEGGERIVLVDSVYEGHLIVQRGNDVRDWYWVDFETEQDYGVSTFKISENKVLVRVYGDASLDYVFNSLGQLNVVTRNVTYFFDSSNVTLVESFESFIVSGFNTTLFLNVTYNRLKYNSSLAVPNASLNWNGTIFPGNLMSFNITDAFFNVTLLPSLAFGVVNITHNWSFSIKNLTNDTNTFVSGNQNQTLFNIVVAPCNSSIPYPIVNFSYFDEVNGSPITLDNGFALSVFDGTFFYNQTSNFSGNTNDALCTNLPPSNITYNWNMWGTLTLQKVGYVTRIFSITEASPLAISNNPMTQLDLFLITLNESSTVTFNWFTTEFQPIDGTMLVYKCNINGTRSLVESVPIVSSQAIANIQLITQPYSYEVIIDGVTIASESFTTCHIEASNTVTFYVDVIQSNLVPVIGMFLVDCSMEKLGNTTVRMSWDSNPFDDDDIEGCLVAFRETFGGLVQIYENCTTGASNSITRTIPDNTFSYVVKGQLTQGATKKGFCQNEVSFIREATSPVLFGIVGLLCAFFLVASMSLFFAEDGESHVISAGIGFFLAWIFGVLAFDWKIVSAVFVFLGFIVVAGRYSRK